MQQHKTTRQVLTSILLVLAVITTPLQAEDPREVFTRNPQQARDTVDALARQMTDAKTIPHLLRKRHPRFGRTNRKVLGAALNVAVAHEIYCIARTEPEPGWKGKSDAVIDELLRRRDEFIGEMQHVHTEKGNRPVLGIYLDLETAGPPELFPANTQFPERIRLTNDPFLYGWKSNDWPAFPGNDGLDKSPRGWPAIERTVVHELAHAAGFPSHTASWREMEKFLWHLLERCSTHLADFGDAHPEPYPTPLLADPDTFFLQLDGYLMTANLVLDPKRLGKLGAHHLNTQVAWLGTRPAKQGVDREGEPRQPRDQFDDGVRGNAFRESITVRFSIDPARWSEGDSLVFDGWIDWDGRRGWDERPREHLRWRSVKDIAGNTPAWADHDGHHLILDPSQWAGAASQDLTLTFDAGGEKAGTWARFRLYVLSADEDLKDLKVASRGPALHGEVEDYMISKERGEGSQVFELGDLTALHDPSRDLSLHYTGAPVEAPFWSDIQNASVKILEPTVTIWTDYDVPIDPDDGGTEGGDGRFLEMEMELYEPIPEAPDAEFASWHFIVDLDGRRSTGHDGAERPVGVFPDLGVDLWADLLWDGASFHPFLFLGADGISPLSPVPDLVTAGLSADRRRVILRVPVSLVEQILSGTTEEPFHANEDQMSWVAVTNHAATPSALDDPPSDFFPDWIYLPETACERVAGPHGLCLGNGRFLVETIWETPQGTRGSGEPVELTEDTGAFWFFDSSNTELLVKVLDACSFADRFWVFAAGLTNVEVELRVTDLAIGETRDYRNPQATPFEPILDASAFATCDAGNDLPVGGSTGSAGFDPETAEPALSLAQDRFRVEVGWQSPHGTSGEGQAVPLSDDTGTFWFFDAANLELVVKVLDGCPVNGRFWVFAGGLTDVEVEITVTDQQTGTVRRYENPMGSPFAPILDASAFATCE